MEESIRSIAEAKVLNLVGWFSTGMAFTMNVNNINSVLTVVISVLSIVFLCIKIFYILKRKGK